MKIRSGFVSNSSSSSFICAVCGNDESGWDLCISDSYMFQCENGHTVCLDHLPDMTKEQLLAMFTAHSMDIDPEDLEDEYSGNQLKSLLNEYFDQSEYPPEVCPICSMSTIEDYAIVGYMTKKQGVARVTVEDEIRSTFKSYDDLINFIK